MKVYTLHRKQFLPIPLESAWSFFSSPKNLKTITPPHMRFHILSITGGDEKMYAGQIIRYRINVLPLVPAQWVTEITLVKTHSCFIDEQRIGPFAMWRHKHHFSEVEGGIEMADEVDYAIPFGILGRLANRFIVHREVNAIFDFRREKLDAMFSRRTNKEIKKSA